MLLFPKMSPPFMGSAILVRGRALEIPSRLLRWVVALSASLFVVASFQVASAQDICGVLNASGDDWS